LANDHPLAGDADDDLAGREAPVGPEPLEGGTDDLGIDDLAVEDRPGG
jgi:hypothetical protein